MLLAMATRWTSGSRLEATSMSCTAPSSRTSASSATLRGGSNWTDAVVVYFLNGPHGPTDNCGCVTTGADGCTVFKCRTLRNKEGGAAAWVKPPLSLLNPVRWRI